MAMYEFSTLFDNEMRVQLMHHFKWQNQNQNNFLRVKTCNHQEVNMEIKVKKVKGSIMWNQHNVQG